MAARPNRVNTPTEQNKEDNALVLYRLQQVEAAVREVSDKFDQQDTIKKPDFVELRDTLITRVNEIRDSLQRDLDDKERALQKQIDAKADQKTVDDIRTLIKAIASFFTAIVTAMVIYYLTTDRTK